MKTRSKFEQAKSKLSRQSQGIAERQARIPAAECLGEAVTEYIEWHAFAYWARLIAEMEGSDSASLHQVLEERCPGFLASAAEHARKHPREPEFLWLRLISWIDDRIFAFAKTEGWASALNYYAARDPRMVKIFAHWQECDLAWKNSRLTVLPDFLEWRADAI
jgi:hypothetical protein